MSDDTPARLPREVQQAVDAYTERLGELLGCCDRDQESDPEAFLWNARRSLEAMTLLLRTVHTGTPAHSGPGDSLHAEIKELSKARVLESEDQIRFQRAREYANLGVHIRKPEREDYRKARDDLRHLLSGLVEWLYTESIASPHLDMDQKARLVNAAVGLRSAPLPPAPTPAELPVAADPPRRRRTWLLPTGLALGSLVVSAAVSMGVLEWADHSDRGGAAAKTGPTTAAALHAGPAARSAPETTEAPTPEPPAAEPPAAEPPPDCPAGMVGVAATTVRLGQPVGGRTDWPPPTRTRLPPRDVAPFCIDARERRLSDLQAWDPAAVAVDPDCDWRREPAGPASAAVCIDRDEAAAYCAAALPGGRLPALVEWEALARTPQARAVTATVYREWVADDFPPTVLARAWPEDDPDRPAEGLFRQDLRDDSVEADGNVLHSWNRQETGNRWRNLGFRCAVDPAG